MMNDRIKELIKKCGGINLDEDGNVLTHFLVGHQIEKFAELIVRECMEQVWYSREDGINGNISEVIKERMKQHFGVEE